MSLLTAELRKVWGNRVFPMLLAVLVAANLLLLWMGTRPTANQPPAAAYRAVGADLAARGSDMAAKGDFLHGKARRNRVAAAARKLLPRPRLRQQRDLAILP